MRRNATRLLFLLLALFVVAGTAEAQKKRGDRSKITRADLDEAGGTVVSAADAIKLLRPQWLQPPLNRMNGSSLGGNDPNVGTEPVLYVDEMRQQSQRILETMPASQVFEMKYLDQNRAIQMYGPGHESGAIQLTTTAKKKP